MCECVNTISSSACSRWNKSSQLLLQLIMSVLRVSECMFTTFGVCVFVFDGILPSKLSPPPQGKLFKHTHSVCDVVDFAVTHVFQCVCLCVIFSTFSFSVHNWCTTMMLKFFSAHFHFFNQNILWRPLWRQNRGFRKMFTSLIFLSLTVQNRK